LGDVAMLLKFCELPNEPNPVIHNILFCMTIALTSS